MSNENSQEQTTKDIMEEQEDFHPVRQSFVIVKQDGNTFFMLMVGNIYCQISNIPKKQTQKETLNVSIAYFERSIFTLEKFQTDLKEHKIFDKAEVFENVSFDEIQKEMDALENTLAYDIEAKKRFIEILHQLQHIEKGGKK